MRSEEVAGADAVARVERLATRAETRRLTLRVGGVVDCDVIPHVGGVRVCRCLGQSVDGLDREGSLGLLVGDGGTTRPGAFVGANLDDDVNALAEPETETGRAALAVASRQHLGRDAVEVSSEQAEHVRQRAAFLGVHVQLNPSMKSRMAATVLRSPLIMSPIPSMSAGWSAVSRCFRMSERKDPHALWTSSLSRYSIARAFAQARCSFAVIPGMMSSFKRALTAPWCATRASSPPLFERGHPVALRVIDGS